MDTSNPHSNNQYECPEEVFTLCSWEWGKVNVARDVTSCGSSTRTVLPFKDCVISNRFVYEWDWSEDGTRHESGITVKALLDALKKFKETRLVHNEQVNSQPGKPREPATLAQGHATNYLEPDLILFSQGVQNRLATSSNALAYARDKYGEQRVQQQRSWNSNDCTDPNAAVETYNRLVKSGKWVILFLHSTC